MGKTLYLQVEKRIEHVREAFEVGNYAHGMKQSQEAVEPPQSFTQDRGHRPSSAMSGPF